MGYTTRFSNYFDFDKELTMSQYNKLIEFADEPHEDTRPVTGYCQWTPTRDGKHLAWDGGEKFYNYVEWLQYLIDNYFEIWNIKINGTVEYQGEDIGDVGAITVKDNVVTVKEYKPLDGEVECPHCGERFTPSE